MKSVVGSLRRALRWLRHWIPFAARTVYYGSISLLVGPLTRDRRASHWAQRSWSRSGLRFLGIAVHAQGFEHVPTGGYAYACNHQSLLDSLVLGATLPGDFKFTVKSPLMLIPFLGWHLWLAGHVRVDRSGGRRAAAAVIRRLAKSLAEGHPLLVFPEGTRSLDGRVQSFKMGLFHAAVRAGVPVVPVALHGTGAAMAKGAPDIGQKDTRKVFLRVGKPLMPEPLGSRSERAASLCARTHAAVVDMHASLASAEPPAA